MMIDLRNLSWIIKSDNTFVFAIIYEYSTQSDDNSNTFCVKYPKQRTDRSSNCYRVYGEWKYKQWCRGATLTV